MGAPGAGVGGDAGEVRQTASAEGPILVDSNNVDTDKDNGESGSETNDSFTWGLASASPTRPGGRPSRFVGRERPGWRSASACGPVRGAAGQDGKAGVVGRIVRVYKGPLSPAVEQCDSPPVRPPPPASRGPA